MSEFDFRAIPNEVIHRSVLNIYMDELADRIAARFAERYKESPQQRKANWEVDQRRKYEQKAASVPSSEDVIGRLHSYRKAAEKRKKEASHGND